MSTLSDYADALVEEGLVEAADTFFGARKRLEDEITVFHQKCRELEHIGQEVVAWGHGLGFLLLEGDRVEAFYRAIGVDLTGQSPLNGSRLHKDMRPGPGLLAGTRYWKTVYKVYQELFQAVDTYLHGRHYDDPSRPGGKKRTICLTTLTTWAERINERIKDLNNNHQASQVLQFAKQFRGDEVEKEKITGAGVVYNLDAELAFEPLDLSQCGLLDFPELPAPQGVKKTVKSFCLDMYKHDKSRILTILHQIEPS
ncbi:hypothetical protein [Desulfoplanes formicivorans]|uniref:Uncharacterized protein n=1 Tax=Desulfoplanes formicivorans TaxID=1592317 RepID=A0A194AL59_9BACT|nr:hypothetical protein [Desulfoplanes formicivorans]GAU09419.1 hypothetical protein DPF_2145 [Desulfoplanes formicivorans]